MCEKPSFEALQQRNFKEKDGLHEWKAWEVKKLEAIVCYIRQHPESIPAHYANKYAYISHHTFGLRISSKAVKTKVEELIVQPNLPSTQSKNDTNNTNADSNSDVSDLEESDQDDSFDSDHI